MKQQLEVLTKELITEVKNIKDLAKEELPLVAKEYIRYNIIVHTIGFIIGILVLVIGIAFCIGIFFTQKDMQLTCVLGSIVFGMLGFFASIHYGDVLLQFKLQPRRMAIKAITSLF